MIIEGLTIADEMTFSQRTITPEGFLEAPATLARTGVHIYRAGEFPQLVARGMDANRVIRLHRPAEELFHPDVMKKGEGMPIIIEPHQTVTSENWRDVAVGDVHGVHREGNLLRASKYVLRDQAAIDALQSGKKYTSNGYTFNLDLTPGTNSDGEEYDGIQRNIVLNHSVICDSPRGGTQCQVADTQPTGENRTMIIKIDGIPVEVGNDTAAAAVQKVIEQRDALLNKQPEPATVTYKVGDVSKVITGSEEIVNELTAKDTEIAALKAQIKTPEQIATMVNEGVAVRVAIIGDASSIIKDFKADGKSNIDIQREVVTLAVTGDAYETAKAVANALLGSDKLEAADAAKLDTIFKAVVPTMKTAAVAPGSQNDPAVARALAGDTNHGSTGTTLVGRDAFIARQRAAWETKSGKKNKK